LREHLRLYTYVQGAFVQVKFSVLYNVKIKNAVDITIAFFIFSFIHFLKNLNRAFLVSAVDGAGFLGYSERRRFLPTDKKHPIE